MSASLGLANEPVELVGPKGYVHGFHYVGGPGLPSVAAHGAKSGGTGRIRAPQAGDDMPSKGYSQPGGLKAGKLQRGDKVMGSFEGGPAGLKMHDVVSAKHAHTSVLTVRNTRTGAVHTQKVNGNSTTSEGGKFSDLKKGDQLQGHFRGDPSGKTDTYEVTSAKHAHLTTLTTRDPDTGQTHTETLNSGSIDAATARNRKKAAAIPGRASISSSASFRAGE